MASDRGAIDVIRDGVTVVVTIRNLLPCVRMLPAFFLFLSNDWKEIDTDLFGMNDYEGDRRLK